jgi:glycosyltransferase involved in cell wall biosynthesis
MRVLIDYRPALRGRSGAGEYTHELTSALLARSAAGGCGRVEITLFSSSWKDRLTMVPELAGAAPIDLRIPVSVLNFAWHRLGWPSAEVLTGRVFDVTHSSHPLLMPARDAAQVITIHDLDFLAHPERTHAEIRRDYPALARSHARRADLVIVPSRFTAGEVERLLDVSPRRIAVCPPGAPDWSPRSRAPRDGYLLFLGTLEPRKNVGVLLDAYEQLLESRGGDRSAGGCAVPELVLAGRATPAADPWLARLARPPLVGHARHIGYVAPEDRRALYEGARLLVLPSLDEGFGIPVLEAMTVGVPVVASRRGALPEVLDGAGVLIDPLGAADLANGMARILDDEPFAAACVTHGIARSGVYRWTETAARVCEAYHRAIAHRAGPEASS